jgi:hypothetical protein
MGSVQLDPVPSDELDECGNVGGIAVVLGADHTAESVREPQEGLSIEVGASVLDTDRFHHTARGESRDRQEVGGRVRAALR